METNFQTIYDAQEVFTGFCFTFLSRRRNTVSHTTASFGSFMVGHDTRFHNGCFPCTFLLLFFFFARLAPKDMSAAKQATILSRMEKQTTSKQAGSLSTYLTLIQLHIPGKDLGCRVDSAQMDMLSWKNKKLSHCNSLMTHYAVWTT